MKTNILNSVNSQYVVYEQDLHDLYQLIDELYKTKKVMQNRFEHKQTVKIAKSVFDYAQKLDLIYENPQLFYDFKAGDLRIYVIRQKDQYYVMRGDEVVSEPFTTLKEVGEAYMQEVRNELCIS